MPTFLTLFNEQLDWIFITFDVQQLDGVESSLFNKVSASIPIFLQPKELKYIFLLFGNLLWIYLNPNILLNISSWYLLWRVFVNSVSKAGASSVSKRSIYIFCIIFRIFVPSVFKAACNRLESNTMKQWYNGCFLLIEEGFSGK